MGSSNWSELSGNLNANEADPINRVMIAKTTAGETGPNGSGTHVFGMRTLVATTGSYALHNNQAGFAPVPPGVMLPIPSGHKSSSIRGAIKRTGPGSSGASAFLFCGLQTADVGATAYMLGLSDGDPSFITLRKGAIADGLPSGAPDPLGPLHILRRSTVAVPIGTWVHLRLDAIASPTGDYVLRCYASELADNPVNSPTWMELFPAPLLVDDPIGANTGSAGLSGGFMGFGGRFSDVGRRVYFSRIECIRGT